VALPALCRLISGDPERYRDAYLRVLRSLLLVTIPVYVFLISYADLIVPLAFGEQWLRAIPMFQWLGLALLVKPIAYTTGWLFISQGRMQELLRWGALAVLLAAASFVAGLPWGATGVAAAYTLVDVFIRAPILFWWVGRSGPVKSLDLLKAAAPIGAASILVALCLYAARWLIPAETAAWLVCLAGVFLTLLVSVGAMTVVPGGRRTFTDAIKLFRQRQA
jgi:PST family polysaccharide transporter